MFSSNSYRTKWFWPFIDLVVVIIGVYVAFLMQSSAAVKNDQREQIKVYSALKMELETMRVGFPRFAQSNIDFLNERKDLEFFDISDWRFIEPQYGYQIIEYSINIQNTDIIDFEMYNELQQLYVGIRQLEHVERLLTEVSADYQYLIPELNESHPVNLERKANNRSRMRRFRMFLSGRVGNLNRSSKKAEKILLSINERLGQDLTKEIERKFMSEISHILSEEEAVQLGAIYFPNFTKEEIIEILHQTKGIEAESQK